MSRTRLLGLAAALIAVGLSAVPASASRQDSWLGHSFMWHLSDVVAYPHRAVQDDWQNEAIAIFVPRNTTSGAPPDERGTPVYDGFDYLQGTVTFGSDNWSLIFAGNEQRGYNPVKAIGTHERMPAEYLVNPLHEIFTTYGLELTGVDYDPNLRMQVGGAVSLSSLDLGLFVSNANSQWTNETTVGSNPTDKVGQEASYTSFTASAGFPNLASFRSFELAASITKGSQEVFGLATDPDVGSGDNSAFAVNGQVHFDTEWLGFVPALNATFGTCKADWSEAADSTETTPTPSMEIKGTVFRAEFGGTRMWTNGSKVAASLGFQADKLEEDFSSGGDPQSTDSFNDKYNTFPFCSLAGEYWVRPWFGLDWGTQFSFEGSEFEQIFRDTDGTVTAQGVEKHNELYKQLGAGVVFRVKRDDWTADFAATLRNDYLGNPGSVLQGKTSTDGNPIIATEARLSW